MWLVERRMARGVSLAEAASTVCGSKTKAAPVTLRHMLVTFNSTKPARAVEIRGGRGSREIRKAKAGLELKTEKEMASEAAQAR